LTFGKVFVALGLSERSTIRPDSLKVTSAVLQWNHCVPMWETLYHGTTSAVRDERTWDGGWDWADNTYSDGRQVMAQVRVKNWQILDRDWPYNGDNVRRRPDPGAPAGFALPDRSGSRPGEGDHYKYHPAIEIDLEELIEQLGPPPLDVNTLDDLAIESAQESLLLEPPGLGRKKGDVPGLRTPRGAPVAGIPVNSSIGGRA
jgi:hypothetical protein